MAPPVWHSMLSAANVAAAILLVIWGVMLVRSYNRKKAAVKVEEEKTE